MSEYALQTLAHALAARGAFIHADRVPGPAGETTLRLKSTTGTVTLVTMPTVQTSDGGFCPVVIDDAPARVVPVPRSFVERREVQWLFVEQSSGTVRCAVDLLALLDWATGYVTGVVPNWSHHVPSGGIPSDTTISYVDDLLDALAARVAGGVRAHVPAVLLPTGDTDCATERELLDCLDTVASNGGRMTLMLRRPAQLTRPVMAALAAGKHELGIHPYAESALWRDYAQEARALAAAVVDATGRVPIAARHHRFQYHPAQRTRSLLASLGVRVDLNLVAASGRSWIGAPTGLSVAAVPARASRPMWLLPTVVEDEVFLYSVDYAFERSLDMRRGESTTFVLSFLEYWILGLGRPACVNCHPEHSVRQYRRLQDAILNWATGADVPIWGMDEFVRAGDVCLEPKERIC